MYKGILIIITQRIKLVVVKVFSHGLSTTAFYLLIFFSFKRHCGSLLCIFFSGHSPEKKGGGKNQKVSQMCVEVFKRGPVSLKISLPIMTSAENPYVL